MSGYNIWGNLTTTSAPSAPIDDDTLINAGIIKGVKSFNYLQRPQDNKDILNKFKPTKLARDKEYKSISSLQGNIQKNVDELRDSGKLLNTKYKSDLEDDSFFGKMASAYADNIQAQHDQVIDTNNLFKDSFTQMQLNMNRAQADTDAGIVNLKQEDNAVLTRAVGVLDALDSIGKYEQLKKTATSPAQLNEANGKLQEYYQTLADNKQYYDNALNIVGKDYKQKYEQWKEDHSDQNLSYKDYLKNFTKDPKTIRQDMLNLINQNQQVIKSTYDDLQTDEKDIQDWNRTHQVSKEYLDGEQKYANASITDPHYWLYQMPGMIGSSMSGWKAQAGAMGTAIGGQTAKGMVLNTLLKNVGSAKKTAFKIGADLATYAGTFLLNREAGHQENEAEVSNKVVDSMQKTLQKNGKYDDVMKELRGKAQDYYSKLGFSKSEIAKLPDEDILRDASAGTIKSNNRGFQDALINGLAGRNAQFANDNAATTADAYVETAMMCLPIGKYLKNGLKYIGKNVVSKGVASAIWNATSKITSTKVGSKIAAIFDKDKIASAFETGANIGDYTGTGIMGRTIAGTSAGAARAAYEAMPEAVQSTARQIQKHLAQTGQTILDKVLPGLEKQNVAKHILSFGNKVLKTSILEGAEEGRQYLNANDQYTKKYSLGEHIGWTEALANDLQQGTRVAQAMAATLGIGDSPLKNDQEFWQNMRGGFALGGFMVGTTNVMTKTPGILKQYQTDKFIQNNLNVDRMASQDEIRKGIMYADNSIRGKQDYVLKSIDDYKETFQRRQADIPTELFDEQKKIAKNVMDLAQNKHIQDKFTENGWKPGTQDFNVAVSLLSHYHNNIKDSNEESIQHQNNISSILNSKEFNDEVEQKAEQNIENDKILQSAINETTAKQDVNEQYEKTLHSEKLRLKTQIVNQLKVLIGLRNDIDTTKEYVGTLKKDYGIPTTNEDSKTISDSIDKQIAEAKKQFSEVTGSPISDDNNEALKQLQQADIVSTKEKELQDSYRSLALLNADKAVSQERIKQLYDNKEESGKSIIEKYKAGEQSNKDLEQKIGDIEDEPVQQEEPEKPITNNPASLADPVKDVEQVQPEKPAQEVEQQQESEQVEEPQEEVPQQEDNEESIIPQQEQNEQAPINPFEVQEPVQPQKEEAPQKTETPASKLFREQSEFDRNQDDYSSSDYMQSQIHKIEPEETSAPKGKSTQTDVLSNLIEKLKQFSKVFSGTRKYNTFDDTFIRDTNGNISVYRNVLDVLPQQYASGFEAAFLKAKLALKKHISSKEEFKEYLKKSQDAYNKVKKNKIALVKYAELYDEKNNTIDNDVLEAVSRLIARGDKSVYVKVGLEIQNLVQQIFTDREPTIKPRTEEEVGVVNDLIEKLYDLKYMYTRLGYSFVTPKDPILSTLSNGTKVFANIDLLAVDKNGDMHIIDVKTSYKSIVDNYKKGRPNKNALFSNESQFTDELSSFAKIMVDEFGMQVKSISILPIVAQHDNVDGIMSSTQIEAQIYLNANTRINNVLNDNSKLDSVNNTIRGLRNQINNIVTAINQNMPEDQQIPDTMYEYESYGNMAEAQLHMTELYDYLNQLQAIQTQISASINSNVDNETYDNPESINKVSSSDNSKTFHNIDQKFISENEQLSNATGQPDFITASNFNVYEEDGKLFVDIKYKNQTFKHLPLYTTDSVKNENLLNKIRLALNFLRGHKDYKINVSVTRTNGKLREGTTGTLQSKGYLDNKQLIDLDPQHSDIIGTYNGDNFVRNASGAVIYTYQNGTVGKLGSVVFLMKQHRGEGSDVTIPVQMWTKPLGKLGAHVVTQLLKEKFIANNINATHNGIDIDQLLRLLVHIEPATSIHDNNTIYVLDNGTVQFNGVQYSLSSDEQLQALANSLSSLNISIDQQLLSPRMKVGKFIDKAGKVTTMLLYNQIQDKLQASKRGTFNPFEEFGYNDFQFNQDDFDAKDSKGNSTGYTGLGYAIKHGILVTNVDGLSNARVSVNDISVIPNEKQVEELQQEEEKPMTNNELWDSIGGELFSKDTNGEKITEDEAIKIIKKLVGNVPVEYFNDFIDTLNQTAGVTGQCVKDCIRLSSNMSNTVPYHEAFHRIVELLLPSNVRQSIYDKYRKQNGLQDATERQIAEQIADDYADFRVNLNKKLNNSNILLRPFIKVYEFTKLFTSLGSRKLAMVYTLAQMQAFKFKKTNAIKQQRFDTVFGNHLEYTVHDYKHGTSVVLENCINSQQLNDAVQGLSFILLRLNGIKATGTNIQDLDLSFDTISKLPDNIKGYLKHFPLLNELFESKTVIVTKKDGTKIEKTVYPKWEAVVPMMASYISSFASDPMDRTAEENVEDSQSDDTASASIEQHVKPSYQYSKLEKTSKQVRYFFATVPYSKFMNTTDDKGNTTRKTVDDVSRNMFGMPVFMPQNTVMNQVFNDFYNIKSPKDLYDGLEKAAVESPMYSKIFARYSAYYNNQLNKDGSINTDNEAMVTLLYGTIKSNKLSFMQCKINQDQQDNVSIVMQDSDSDFAASALPKMWSKMLVSGASGIFKVFRDTNGSLLFNEDKEVFRRMAVSMYNLTQALFNSKVKINGKLLTDASNFEDVKQQFIQKLNKLGITITKDVLDYMLFHKYGSSGILGMQSLVAENRQSSFKAFVTLLGNMVNPATGEISTDIDNIFTKSGFVKELAKWQYRYNKTREQLMVIAAGGNKNYMISENNTVSDRIDMLNNNDGNDQDMQNIKSFVYNIDEQGQGSIILKQLQLGKTNFQVKTFAGIKTDNIGDKGSDYFQIVKREDYISKLSILLDGGLVLPTLSDKKTWMYITNVAIPGLDFSKPFVDNNGNLTYTGLGYLPEVDSKGLFINTTNTEVLDQIIEYAITEKKAIEKCMEDLQTIKEEDKVINYHTSNKNTVDKHAVEPNGTRFSSLLGIYTQEGFVSFNDPRKSSKANLETANRYFFDLAKEQQRAIISNIIQRQVDKEIKTCIDLGIVESTRKDGKFDYHSLKNIGLDSQRLLALTNRYSEGMKDAKGVVSSQNFEVAESLAIVAMIHDATTKSIMSIQESERVFSGHPAFFKWKYGATALEDRHVDEVKRFGGIISTGQNNRQDFMDGVLSTYKCAEINDYEIASPIYEQLSDLFYSTELKEAVYNYTKSADVYNSNMSVEEMEELLPEDMLNIVKNKSKVESDSYSRGINVADGAAYITEEMTESLLRQLGLYSQDVKEAFALLKTGTDDILKQQKAYKKILDLVVGTQKYSAYGYRYQNGLLIPYYNKMALFPLFKSIATGQMADIYEKMQDTQNGGANKVDMLMMNSAVKMGSQGAVSFEDIKAGSAFNTYEQNLRFIRKQLNTDPNEKEFMSMGTQATKIAMSNLKLDRTYKDGTTGEIISGQQVLSDIMGSMNILSDLGKEELLDEFTDKNESGERVLNQQKLSDFLVDELSGRSADDNMIEGVSIVTEPDGSKHLSMPLSSISNMGWLESILISHVNKKIVDLNLPGNAFVQRSVFAMEGNEHFVLSDKDVPSINNGEKLKTINEEGSMDSVISIDYFEYVIPNYKNITFEEAKQWLLDNNIIGKNSKACTVSYRIPTQAISSIHALRFVDVLPVVRDTIILPEEFTKITGSDFDIDKMFLSRMNYNVHEDGHVDTEFDETTNPKEYYQNRMLNGYLTLLKDSENSTNQLMRSIDNDTSLVKDIASNAKKDTSITGTDPYEFYTPHFQVNVKDDYITGKIGIGPFALNNNSQILTMLYNIKFKPTTNGLTDALNINALDKRVDKDGNSIMSWLSALINAHVDIAKDAFISRLNVNSYTYNMVNLLIRTGIGDSSFYFITQPIIKKMAEAYNSAAGQYLSDPRKTKSQLQAQAVKDVLEENIFKPDFVSDKNYQDRIRRQIQIWTDNTTGAELTSSETGLYKPVEYFNNICKYLMLENNSILKDIYENGYDINSEKYYNVNGHKMSVYEIQLYMSVMWKKLSPYAQQLSDFVKYCKIDTKKQGKSIVDQKQFRLGYNKLFDVTDPDNMFDGEGLLKLQQESYIGTKTENALNAPLQILQDQIIQTTNGFDSAYRELAFKLGRSGALDSKFSHKLDNILTVYIKSKFFNRTNSDGVTEGYLSDIGMDEQKQRQLFYGDHSIVDRLNEIKSKILTDEAYAHLRTQDGSIVNDLIDQLIPAYQYNATDTETEHPKFVQLFNSLQDQSNSSNNIIKAWEDLLTDQNETIRDFARDLVVYSFLSSGDAGGINSLFKYVPNSWRKDSGYCDYIAQTLQKLKADAMSSEIDTNDIIRNNWFDSQIVHTYDLFTKADCNFVSITDSNRGNIPFLLSAVKLVKSVNESNEQIYTASVSVNKNYNTGEYPTFIKVKVGGTKDDSSYQIYRLAGTHKLSTTTKSGKPNIIEVPFYFIQQKSGMKYKGFQIIEYGKTDTDALAQPKQYDNEALDRGMRNIQDYLNNNRYIQTDTNSPQDVIDMMINDMLNKNTYDDDTEAQTNDENIVQQDNPNKEGDYIDVQHNGTIQEQIQTIQSNKTILSNQEILQLKPYTGSDTRPRIAVASEHTDPAFFSKRIVDLFDGKTSVVDYKGNTMTGDDFDALYIITKHDGLPMLDILNIQKPKIIHFSITTLGGSKWEPGVMKYNDLLDKIQSYIKQGLDPDMVTVRIDPIIPGVTLMSDVENVIKRSSEMGIKKIRFSVLDFYKTTAKYMQNLGFDYDKYYDPIVDVTGKQVISNGQKLYKPNARNEVLDNIANKMLQISSKYNVLLSTCAEPMVKQGITKEGCLSVQAINDMLGTHVEDKDTDNNKFRNLCSCYGGKTDILRYDSNCASSCMYCYAHHNSDKMLNYYNEDGSLKDNKFTQSEPNKKSEDVVINNIRYNRDVAEQRKDWLFIFTDNTDRTSGGFNYEDGWYKEKYGNGGYGSRNNPTTAVIRGLDNAFPISTMKWFYKNHVGATVNSSRFTDQDFEQFKKVIDDEFNDIKQAWESGKYTKIVIPGDDGFFNSRISNISEIRTPQIYQYLKQKESELMNIVQTNDKNIIEPNEELQYTTEMQNILDNASRNEQSQLLAPNGKVSNLNERQYAQVRTKSFKEWFGDWESIAEKTNYGNLIGNNSFTDLINEDGTPNWDKFDKIFDKYFNEAPDSAFSKGRYNLRNRPENHDLETNTREHIENVVQSAMKLNVSKEIRNNLIIAAMLHDIAKPFRTGDAHGLDAIKIINELFSNSKDANMIKLAVRHHMFSDSQGKFNIEEARKIIKDAYNAKVDVNQFIQLLLALNTADITRNREDNAIDSYSKKTIKETIIEEYDYKKSLLTRALNELADVSKVIDENGEPLVVYHNTDYTSLVKFSTDKIGSVKPSYYGKGFYFSSNKEYASQFGKNTIAAFINARNISHTGNDMESQIDGYLTDKRYDANWITVEEYNKDLNKWIETKQDEIVVRNPNQIKSATNNVGTFSKENDNINDTEEDEGEQIKKYCKGE